MNLCRKRARCPAWLAAQPARGPGRVRVMSHVKEFTNQASKEPDRRSEQPKHISLPQVPQFTKREAGYLGTARMTQTG